MIGSVSSSHRRTDSFPVVYVIDEDDNDGYPVEGRMGVSGGRSRGRTSIDVSMMEDYTLRSDGDVFLSLSQNMSTGEKVSFSLWSSVFL